MKRANGEIELTREEIIYLWEKEWGVPMPEDLGLRSAAEAVLLVYGVERMAICLRKFKST